jgi:hypothetical protein
MGHSIKAIIGKKTETNIDVIKKYELAAAFEKEFTIIILEDDSIYHWSEKLNYETDSESDDLDFASPIVFKIANDLGFKKYALIKTDYFGGGGGQIASLYENTTCIIKENTINNVLKELGVVAIAGNDEFDEINLREYRSAEYYYWDTNNWAETKTNMIAGRIPLDCRFR